MIFASNELAARIERCECGLIRDCTTSVAANRPEMDTMLLDVGGGVASYAGPGSPINKVAGMGFAGPVDAGALEQMEAEFARRSAPVQIELSIHADSSIAPLLSERGYLLRGFENVMGLSLPVEVAGAAPGIEVAASGAPDLESWLDIVVTGFAAPDVQGVASHESYPREVIEGVIRDMASGPAFLRYSACLDGIPAGGASMRVADGIAQLCGAATLPAMRRRGVQSALLGHRLRCAGEAGCVIAVVTTMPGSKSAENVRKMGFELLYTRVVMVLSAAES